MKGVFGDMLNYYQFKEAKVGTYLNCDSTFKISPEDLILFTAHPPRPQQPRGKNHSIH